MVTTLLKSDSTLKATGSVPGVENEREFQQVLAEFGPALARLSLGYEFDTESRRDLEQDILVAVWQSLTIFDSRCSLRTWVYRVAHNTAAKHVIREKRRAFASLKSLEEIDEPEHPGNLVDEVDRDSALKQLSRLLSQLMPLDRQVILLYLEDVAAAQIAEITGLSAGSVGVRIHRIKHLLRKIFDAGTSDAQR
jgi:RNA polymerase sigma-70 factor (ECF subfamily)